MNFQTCMCTYVCCNFISNCLRLKVNSINMQVKVVKSQKRKIKYCSRFPDKQILKCVCRYSSFSFSFVRFLHFSYLNPFCKVLRESKTSRKGNYKARDYLFFHSRVYVGMRKMRESKRKENYEKSNFRFVSSEHCY